MRIDRLSLTNFRNYSRLELRLPREPLLLHGPNAQGKTNLLEAIYVLATGHSPLTSVDREMIRWQAEDEGLPYARVGGEVTSEAESRQVEIVIEKRELAGGGTRTQKAIRIDGVRKRRADLAGLLNVVLFVPQDVTLVSGSPSGRRRHLDDVLCQADAAYCTALDRYEKAVRQRNAALRHLRERGGDQRQLDPFEDAISRHGVHVTSRRAALVEELSRRADRLQGQLTAGVEKLRLDYQPSLKDRGAAADESVARYREYLVAHRGRDIARGMTLSGPHRDELRFIATSPPRLQRGVDLATYGSRGQMRTAVLALKLAELEWMRESGRSPVLLLDEVMAEMDAARRAYLLAQIDSQTQTLLTATDPEMFSPEFRERAAVWEVREGLVSSGGTGQ
jgi:DNA replication and repair protein RecF